MLDVMLAQAAEVAQGTGFWGGAGIGGTVAGGSVFALFLFYLDRQTTEHRKHVQEVSAAAAADAKEARERYQVLLTADHSDTKELTAALVRMVGEQRAVADALTALAGEVRASSNVTQGQSSLLQALVAEVKAWRKTREA